MKLKRMCVNCSRNKQSRCEVFIITDGQSLLVDFAAHVLDASECEFYIQIPIKFYVNSLVLSPDEIVKARGVYEFKNLTNAEKRGII